MLQIFNPIINTIGILPFHFILIALSLFCLVKSADAFIDGASSIATHFNISKLIIGIFFIGIGTSLPEMIVSAMAAFDGKSALSLGNVLGSNIANISLIIGVTALLCPIVVQSSLLKKEFIIMIAAAFIAGFTIYDGSFSRFDSIIIFLFFCFFMGWILKSASKEKDSDNKELIDESISILPLAKAIIFTIFGLIFLLLSSNLLVFSASEIALYFGASELVIGLTIVAVGTSLPELAASLVAAKKQQPELAIGNILGSNIFNVLAVLPVAGFIKPYQVDPTALSRDLPIMIFLSILFLLMSYPFKTKVNGNGVIKRVEGGVLLSIFVLYQGYLILNIFI